MTVKSNHAGKRSGKTTDLHSAKAFPFRTIVAATDFSEESSAALRCAQAIARRQHAMLLLIHVIDPVGYAFPEGAPAQVGRDAAARVELARIEAEVRQHGIPVHSRVETGLVCERICCPCAITKPRCWCWEPRRSLARDVLRWVQ